jgi:hypothetical protein
MMMEGRRFPRLGVLAGALVMVLSCATAPKRSESAPARAQDSAPEKVAAQRAAAPHALTLEQDDERWGIDAARERKRQKDAAKARQQAESADQRVDVTTPPR